MRSPRLKPKYSPKPKLFRFIVFLSLMVLVPLLTLPIIARVYLRQGDRLFEQKQLEQAIAAYTTALRFQANFASVYLRLGKALFENKQFPEALVAYNKALLINPNLSRRQVADPSQPSELAFDFNSLGVALLSQGNLSEAVMAYQKAIQLDPLLTDAHNNLGEALAKQEKWEEAGQYFKQVIQLEPNNAEAYVNLGKVLSEQKKWDEASSAYSKALELKPLDASVHEKLAKVLVEKKQFKKAEVIYLKAISLAPNQGNLYNELGEVLYEQRKVEQAIAAYQQALTFNPDNAEIYKNFCYARHSQGNYQEALNLCRQAIKLDPAQGGAKFYVTEVERGMAIHKNPKLLQMPENIPSSQKDPLINVKRSIVKIIVKSSTFQGVGTGWVLKKQGNKAWIVTNRHVISNPEQKEHKSTQIMVEFYSQPLAGQLRKRTRAKIIQQTSTDDWLDLAVLEVNNIPQDIQPLSWSSASPLPASKIQVIGHPVTRDDWSVASGEVQYSTDQELYLSVVLASGNSGGPVLNEENQVIGLVVKAGLFCPQSPINNTVENELPTPMNLSLNELGCGMAFPVEIVKERLNTWQIK